MATIKILLKQLRVTQWSKNLILFLPMFFGTEFFLAETFLYTTLAVISFSFLASSVYVLNDIIDLEADRKHLEKRNRPLAAGQITLWQAYCLIIICISLSLLIQIIILNPGLLILGFIFFIANIIYSLFAKNLPLWDMFFVAIMYLIRLLAGAVVGGIAVSGWLFVTVFFGALVLIVGKRFTELKNQKVRKVLSFYTIEFLRTLLQLSIGVTLAAFSIYAINQDNSYIPLLIVFTFIFFRYYFLLETTDRGEKPEMLLLTDLQILSGIILFIVYSAILLYV